MNATAWCIVVTNLIAAYAGIDLLAGGFFPYDFVILYVIVSNTKISIAFHKLALA